MNQPECPAGEVWPGEEDIERLWQVQRGVDSDGKAWLTPRMQRMAERLAKEWEKQDRLNEPETIEVDRKALVELVKEWRLAMQTASRGFRRDEREWTDIYANGVNAGKALALGRCIDELEIVIKSGPTQKPCYGIS